MLPPATVVLLSYWAFLVHISSLAAPALDHLRPTFAIGFFLARYPSDRPTIESKDLK